MTALTLHSPILGSLRGLLSLGLLIFSAAVSLRATDGRKPGDDSDPDTDA